MRASVDNPELLKLFGGKPDTAAAISWALGISLSALAGILLVPVVGLDYFALTLLVVNAYAAAMMGRLKSLPLTFAGAMTLGVLDSLALGYIPPDSFLANVRPALPPLLLFALVIMLPQAQLRVGQVKGWSRPPCRACRSRWRRAGCSSSSACSWSPRSRRSTSSSSARPPPSRSSCCR